MESKRPFKVAFPEIVLPANFGGKRAIVVMSLSRPTNPRLLFGTCIDIDGRVHQMVPLALSEVREARFLTMMEVDNVGSAPIASGIVDPTGRAL
jgi:hypothetical protein